MLGVICAIIISVVLPLGILIYALVTKHALPFILGVLTFVISQMVLRLPLLAYISRQSISFNMMHVTKPIVYVLIIGFSAGIFEEVARYIAIRFLMRRRDFHGGLLFGVGHGGIEAVIFLGVQAIMLTASPSAFAHSDAFLLGSVERFFAVILHIGLSMIVLTGVVVKQIRYLILAILLHGVIDSIAGFVPMIMPSPFDIIVIEGALIIMSVSVMIYSIQLHRRGVI